MDRINEGIDTARRHGDKLARDVLLVAKGDIEMLKCRSKTGTLKEEEAVKVVAKIISSNEETIGYNPTNIHVLRRENELLNNLLPEKMDKEEIYSLLEPSFSKIESMPKGPATGFCLGILKKSGKMFDTPDVLAIIGAVQDEQIKN